jgi:hypothetical protein
MEVVRDPSGAKPTMLLDGDSVEKKNPLQRRSCWVFYQRAITIRIGRYLATREE